jgi:hypothetical protein
VDLHFANPHERTARLIPWLVNGTLQGDVAAAARLHLAECAQCRSDYEGQQQLQGLMRAEGPLVFAAEPSFQKLMLRLEASEPANADLPEDGVLPEGMIEKNVQTDEPVIPRSLERQTRVRRSGMAIRWLAAAVVVQAMALGLGSWIWYGQEKTNEARYAAQASREPSYATLTSSSVTYGSGRRIRVVFWPNLSLDELKGVLHTVGAHVVDGPTDSNVYTLGFGQPLRTDAELETRIAALRASSAVLFAEPAQPVSAP